MRPEVENRVKLIKTILNLQYCPWQFDNWERIINNDIKWTQEEKDYALGFVNERRNEVRAQLNK